MLWGDCAKFYVQRICLFARRNHWLSLSRELVSGISNRCHRDKIESQDLQRRLSAIAWPARIRAERGEVDQLKRRLEQSMAGILESRAQENRILRARLRSLGPKAVLERGFALAVDSDGRLIRSVEGRMQGDKLELHLADGRLLVTIDDVQESSQ